MAETMREKNLQSSILFMQQDHANTLKALHEEIEHLQKRCSDLTFQLAMQATTTPEQDGDKVKISNLEKELSELRHQRKLSNDEADTVSKKNEKIHILENQLKAQEMKYMNELKVKGQTIAKLKTELDQKAATIAELASKLRSLHRERASNWKPVIEPNNSEFESVPRVPAPPRTGTPRYHRRSSASQSSLESNATVLNNVIPRPPSSRRLSTPDKVESIPDPTPFLQQYKSTEQVKVRASIAPLPPINMRGSTADVKGSLALRYAPVQKDTSPPSSSPEVETLAIDPVPRKHHVSRPHKYHSEPNGT